MVIGIEPSVAIKWSSVQTTTSPARASLPDLAERIFSAMVLRGRVSGIGIAFFAYKSLL
jgi:hypothetical protein